MGVTSIQTQIHGKVVKEPVDWQNNSIVAAFGTDSAEPQIETDRFEYVLDAADAIIKHRESGSIFVPLLCQQTYYQGDNTYVALDGAFNMADGYEELEPTWGDIEKPNRVMVKFKQNKSLVSFLDQINGVTYGSLVEEGLISSQDYKTINTTIIKRTNFAEIALMFLSIYLIQKQIADAVRVVREIARDVAAFVSTLPGGGVGAAIYATASLIIQVAYALLLVALLITMVKQLIDLLIPPVVKNKGILFRTLLSKACEKFGYTLVSPIAELDTYYYMPSKPHNNDINLLIDGLIPKYSEGKVGIPNVADYGYLVNEMFDLMKSMFNTKIAVVGKEVHLRNANDEYWLKQSTFVPHKSINFPSKKYNTDELKHTRMMTFDTDLKDEWTVENFKGTSYEIKTTTSGGDNENILGLERIGIPLCLPNSKDKPTNIDTIMITLGRWSDSLSRALGQNTNIAGEIQSNRVNILKVSGNYYSKPKIVLLEGSNIPRDHRDKLSAKFLMEKYHYGKSFVTNGALGQKVIYEEVEIPFNLSDLQKTLKNGTFVMDDGRQAMFRNIEYFFAKDTATCTIEVQEIYAKGLREYKIEPE